jgi:hypothetical protein
MRDLREDLRQRLQSIAIEKGTLSERLAYLEQVERNTKSLLEYEVMRVKAETKDQPALFPEDPPITDNERTVLSQFLRDALMDGRPRSLEDLKRLAVERGVQFGEKNPGRVLHFALLGMAQSGAVEMVDKGVWRISRAA